MTESECQVGCIVDFIIYCVLMPTTGNYNKFVSFEQSYDHMHFEKQSEISLRQALSEVYVRQEIPQVQ